ncbi:hypothetical protein VNO80_01985 [Phaseolus coccineus]|uniref:Uncharacterized protein n=1 Tax=Phaseolus coccineus TaxID=3886 RepID=A0AAN9WY38_PHACN
MLPLCTQRPPPPLKSPQSGHAPHRAGAALVALHLVVRSTTGLVTGSARYATLVAHHAQESPSSRAGGQEPSHPTASVAATVRTVPHSPHSTACTSLRRTPQSSSERRCLKTPLRTTCLLHLRTTDTLTAPKPSTYKTLIHSTFTKL